MGHHVLSVDLACPICDQMVTATLVPADHTTGPAGWVVEEVRGCPHEDELIVDEDFVDDTIEAAEEDLARAYDDAMEAKGDRERDGC